MRLDIHLHHHADPVDTRVVDKIDLISAQLEILMDALDRIEAAVSRQTTLEDSSLALIVDLKHQVAEALSGTRLSPEVEARLAKIFPVLEANNDRVAAALAANTNTVTPVEAPATDPAATSAIGTTSTDVSGAGANTGSFATGAPTDELPASSS